MTDAEYQRDYERRTRHLFEIPPKAPRDMPHEPVDGRVKCGGGYRRFLVAGSGSE